MASTTAAGSCERMDRRGQLFSAFVCSTVVAQLEGRDVLWSPTLEVERVYYRHWCLAPLLWHLIDPLCRCSSFGRQTHDDDDEEEEKWRLFFVYIIARSIYNESGMLKVWNSLCLAIIAQDGEVIRWRINLIVSFVCMCLTSYFIISKSWLTLIFFSFLFQVSHWTDNPHNLGKPIRKLLQA